MTIDTMPSAVAESKIARIERVRALGAAQGDIEAPEHLGQHPDNVDRTAKVEREAAAKLRSYVTRIEKLNEEKAALQSDIADLFKSAKGDGFDAKAMRAVIKRRAMDPGEAGEADELDLLIETYRARLGG